MNAVERVLWYADTKSLPQEKAHEIASHKPASDWPADGQIIFENVIMSYRVGLPAVLDDM